MQQQVVPRPLHRMRVRMLVAQVLDVYATIANALDSVRDEYDEKNSTYGSASVSASNLNANGGAVQSARARGWFNDDSVAEDYWSGNAR